MQVCTEEGTVGEVYCVEERTLGVQFLNFFIEIDQSEMTKSHMLNSALNMTNYKCLMAK